MLWFRLTFLVTVLLVSSGYRFRCYWMCTDQTAIQNDYIEERDRCRDYAETKVDLTMHTLGKTDDKTRKSQLVALFSECMSNHGWTVPDGKDKAAAPAVAAAATSGATSGAPVPTPAPGPDKAFISRSAECDFARYSSTSSSIAAARAKACDLECEQRVKAAPDAPRPAACPSEFKPGLSKGVERE